MLVSSALHTLAPPLTTTCPATSDPTAKIRMANPEYFEGQSTTVNTFMYSCVNIFLAQLTLYAMVETCVHFALSFIRGDAMRWKNVFFKEMADANFKFDSWRTFEECLRDTFANPHIIDEAQCMIRSIHQGHHPAEEFFVEFEDLCTESGFNEAAVIFYL